VSDTPPHDDDRARWDRNLEHVRALRAALAANDYTELTMPTPAATPAALDAADMAERTRFVYARRYDTTYAEARAAQEAVEEADQLAEVIQLHPTAEGCGK
jgi:hypothetical protein